MLSEFEADGYEGSLVWRRDLVYAGGRLLGSIKNATARPTLAFTTATSNVGENAGSASLLVQLTTGSALGCPVSVSYQTGNGTAPAGQDYTATSGTLTIPAEAASAAIAVAILNDPLYEPTETFTVTLSTPGAPATIARATGQGTILDNPRVDIDPALAGQYLADLNAGPDVSDWLVIGNPHAVAVTARLTWVRPDGTDVRRELVVPAQQRVTLCVADEPGIANQGGVSVAVQGLDAAHPLVVEHSACGPAVALRAMAGPP